MEINTEMDEARRFLRYVIPGLSFVVQTILLLWGLIPKRTEAIIADLHTDKGIGIAIAALLLSGGLGFVFSMIHHSLLWGTEWRWVTGSVNHESLIAGLRSRNVLSLLCPRCGHVLPPGTSLNRFAAWAIVAALWHERIEISKNTSGKIKSAEPRADSLANLVHSLGAARVASFFALMLAFVIVNCSPEMLEVAHDVWRYVGTIVIATALLYLNHFAFKRTGLAAQRVVEQVLTDALVDESKASRGPVKTHVVLKE